jgi:hypothetical protein
MGAKPVARIWKEMSMRSEREYEGQPDQTEPLNAYSKRAAYMTGSPVRKFSPAAGTPFVDVGLLFTQGRVVAVAWVEPGVVGQDVEQPRLNVVDQRREVLRG